MSETAERIAELIRQGRKIEAIKLLRESTGIDLKRAKDEIDRLEAGQPASVTVPDLHSPGSAAPPGNVSPEVIELARQGKKIAAIKLLRQQTGLGLKEAKQQIDAITGHSGSGCLPGVLLLFVGMTTAVATACNATFQQMLNWAMLHP